MSDKLNFAYLCNNYIINIFIDFRDFKKTKKICIVKNKIIIIYQNSYKYKFFKLYETTELNEDELYILDFLLKIYLLYEILIGELVFEMFHS